MSAFGDFIKGVGNTFSNGLAGGLAGAAVSGISSLFQPSKKKLIKWQKDAQMELNEQAAGLNYDYGEKAAQNAYNRQMQMYERSYEDQSYQAMRKQMENAGLSVGLMYGNGGSGGGAGEMTGAPMGETGGAIAGNASDAIGMALQYKRLQNETMLANANAALAKSQAHKNEVDAADTEATRDARIENYNKTIDKTEEEIELLHQQGKAQWLENIRTEFINNHDANAVQDELGMEIYKSDKYGEATIGFQSSWIQGKGAELNKLYEEVYNTHWAGELDKEKAENYLEELAIAWANADAHAMEAAAKQLATLYETGENVNWKNVLESVTSLLNAVAGAGANIYTKGRAGKVRRSIGKYR